MTGKLRFDQLTIGELGFLEERGKLNIANFDGEFTSVQMGALAYVLKKRFGSPTFTWNEALSLTLQECQELLENHLEVETEEEDPKVVPKEPTTPDGYDLTVTPQLPSQSSSD
jgi:hypothetical protein